MEFFKDYWTTKVTSGLLVYKQHAYSSHLCYMSLGVLIIFLLSCFQACGKFESCKNKGLHGHHPRDCLYYLRDFNVAQLQKLLKDNNIEFDIGMYNCMCLPCK